MKNLPEINFLETDPQFYIDEQIEDYEKITKRKLSVADPIYLLFKSIAYTRTKHAIRMNDALRQQLLAYARRDNLDYKGERWSEKRIGGDKATVTQRFYLEESRAGIAYIKKGTTVTPNGDLLFATLYDAVASDEQSHIDVACECIQVGAIGNGFLPGEINEIINPIQYVRATANITESAGGTEIEDDESYRKRIQSAPEKLSTAGPDEGYKHFTYSVSPLIADVDPYSPEPGKVDVRFLLKGGELPGEEMIERVREALNDKKVRPLTDQVTVSAPEVIEYDVEGKYYLPKEVPDLERAKEQVEEAKRQYVIWQSEKMGRDINPSKLIEMCVSQGAKRIELTAPTFFEIKRGQVAKLKNLNLEFGGVEDE